MAALTIRVGPQLWTCAGMVVLAALFTTVAHPAPAFGSWRTGRGGSEQILIAGLITALAVGALGALAVLLRTRWGGAVLPSVVPRRGRRCAVRRRGR